MVFAKLDSKRTTSNKDSYILIVRLIPGLFTHEHGSEKKLAGTGEAQGKQVSFWE